MRVIPEAYEEKGREREKSQTKSQAFIVARVRSIDVHTPRVLPTIVREGEREKGYRAKSAI